MALTYFADCDVLVLCAIYGTHVIVIWAHSSDDVSLHRLRTPLTAHDNTTLYVLSRGDWIVLEYYKQHSNIA